MFDVRHRQYDRRPSPPNVPPIVTLSSTNSPATSVSSLDHSSVSTPPIRHSSPHSHTVSPYYASHQPYYSHPPPPPPVNHHHNHYSHRGYDSHEGSPYSVPTVLPPFSHHSMSGTPGMGMAIGQVGGMSPAGREQYGLPGGLSMSYPGMPMSSNISVVYTEDAATKLSDRVRRRCFNCCTSDTSTWRRSNLSPGKVVSLNFFQLSL